MTLEIGLPLVSIIAGGVASITGFGIGSLITPVLSLSMDTKLAVAAVSIPHFVATALRFWMMRAHVDRRVLLGFGITSAAGGLTGALLHSAFATPALTLIFGLILIFSGFMGATELSQKMRFRGRVAWWAGAFSGFLGGMVGNQGGIRSAAMLGFALKKETFVATATAIGLAVDIARMPVYFWAEGKSLLPYSHAILVMSVCVVVGTFLGARFLKLLPERLFRRILCSIIFLLGVFMTYQAAIT